MFNKVSTVAILLIAVFASSSLAISPWFTSSYNDIRNTLKRYSYCVKYLDPIKPKTKNSTFDDGAEYLITQITTFLDIANFHPDQATSLSSLMYDICNEHASDFPVADAVPSKAYRESKILRCKAIDEAMNEMYPILKRAAYNKTEKLDFSPILINNPVDPKESSRYNLTDLIVTSWITSNASLPQVCKVTDAVRAHLQKRASERRESIVNETNSTHWALTNGIVNFVSSTLDNLFSINRSAYWGTSTALQQVRSNVEQGARSTVGFVASGLKGARNRLPFFRSSTVTNSTMLNSTLLNSTVLNNNSAQTSKTVYNITSLSTVE